MEVFKHIEIQRMTVADLELVTLIEQQTAIAPWGRDLFNSCLGLYDSYVALIDKVVVGFGIITIYNQIQEAHILNIGVDSKFQRQKIGSYLLTYLINSCAHLVKSILLEVSIHNHAAINLYKKFNFVNIGVRKNYYLTINGSRHDALVFMLNL